ncbi:MAG TPA: ATP-binding protein [Polyangiaceae bacterium]|nr:ATP-binding protein [Polyangiaceae bacterium]
MTRIADLIYTRRSVDGHVPVSSVAKLFEAEPRLDALATLEPDGTFGLVLRARLTQELGRQFGYALFARKPIRVFNEQEFLSCDAAAEPVRVIAEATKRPESAIYDDIAVTVQGRFHGLVSMRLLMAHGKDLLVRSMAEVDALELQNQQLDELNRAQREFVANITHELRAPLNTMLGVANLLSLDPRLSDARRDDVKMLLGRGRDLLALVNNLLELHRLESGQVEAQPTPTRIVELFDDCVAAAGYLLDGRPVELTPAYATLPRTVKVDGVLLGRVLTNLLSNAAKFTECGNITVAGRVHEGALELRVSDTGIGIAERDMTKLFRKFTQLSEAKTKRHTGTGLGLVIVRDLVTLMGGHVSVESRLGAGTSFTVRVPLDTSPPPIPDP